MASETETVTLRDIALLAGSVTAPAVANWRKRFDDFPQPIGKDGRQPLFNREDVIAWLTANGKAVDPTNTDDSLLAAVANLLRQTSDLDAVTQLGLTLNGPDFEYGTTPVHGRFSDEIRRLRTQFTPNEVLTAVIDRLVHSSGRRFDEYRAPKTSLRSSPPSPKHPKTPCCTTPAPASGQPSPQPQPQPAQCTAKNSSRKSQQQLANSSPAATSTPTSFKATPSAKTNSPTSSPTESSRLHRSTCVSTKTPSTTTTPLDASNTKEIRQRRRLHPNRARTPRTYRSRNRAHVPQRSVPNQLHSRNDRQEQPARRRHHTPSRRSTRSQRRKLPTRHRQSTTNKHDRTTNADPDG